MPAGRATYEFQYKAPDLLVWNRPFPGWFGTLSMVASGSRPSVQLSASGDYAAFGLLPSNAKHWHHHQLGEIDVQSEGLGRLWSYRVSDLDSRLPNLAHHGPRSKMTNGLLLIGARLSRWEAAPLTTCSDGSESLVAEALQGLERLPRHR